MELLSQQIINVYSADYGFFFLKPNVVGIAYGYKITKGINTCKPSIQVFVIKKLSSNCIPRGGMIPPLYKGIETDVIETGEFVADNNNYQNALVSNETPFTQRIRPIQPGYCISCDGYYYYLGTFGYIVLDNEQVSKTYCLLSVKKALAPFPDVEIGTEIVQPAFKYDGEAPMDTVAKLLRTIELKFSDDPPERIEDFNIVDASIASYFNIGEVQLINPFIPCIGIPIGINNSPQVNDPIQWTGCISGCRKSFIKSIGAIVKVRYSIDYAWFRNITVDGGEPCNSEDQGALACDIQKKAIGLLFGRSDNLNVICPIKAIEDILKVTLLTA